MTLLAILGPGIAGLSLYFWARQHWSRNEPAVIAGAGALVALLLILVVSVWLRGRQLEAAQAELQTAALVQDSLETAASELRQVNVRLDSGRIAWARRAFQAEVERDDLDRELRTERRATAALTAEIRELRTTAGGTVTIDSARPDIRLVASVIREPPFTVEIRGEIAPDTARLSVVVRVDPIVLEVSHRCGEALNTGIRPAHVTVEGPDWLEISDVLARTDPEACNPPPYDPGPFERARIAAPYAGGTLVVGLIVGLLAR